MKHWKQFLIEAAAILAVAFAALALGSGCQKESPTAPEQESYTAEELQKLGTVTFTIDGAAVIMIHQGGKPTGRCYRAYHGWGGTRFYPVPCPTSIGRGRPTT